ncbi:MAG: hypothetical protein ABI841_04825 [Chloroflexota bacterium]
MTRPTTDLLLGAFVGMMLSGCAALFGGGPQAVAQPAAAPLGDPTCLAESYDFVGEGTLRGLGLDVATPVPPPEPDRVAMIWVTHDLKPFDAGPVGGGVEMTRMLCFEFADGSGGTEWPVDDAWQPPARLAPPGNAAGVSVPPALLVLAAVALLAIGVSVFAFRKRG